MIHLRLRTEFSFGKAYGPITRVIKRVKKLKQSAAAICDGGTWGHVAFYNECKKNGIKPILGAEIAVVANAKLREKQPPNYMAFLAKNNDGLQEIYSLVSESTTPENYYYIPRIDYATVEGITDNVIVLSGPTPNLSLLKPSRNLYIEQTFLTTAASLQWAKDNNIEVVPTCDNYYTRADDKIIYEIMLHKDRDNKTYPMHIPDDYEMEYYIGKFSKDITQHIADQCNVDLPKAQLVRFDRKQTLEEICREAASKRKVDLSDPVYEQRMMRELDLIKEKDFEDYFYVLWDLIAFAKTKMLVGPARGSSCGSLVCYLLGITEIDPIPYDLLFERFIDLTRGGYRYKKNFRGFEEIPYG